MVDINARSNAELAASRAAAVSDMIAFRAHLKVLSRPFGLKDAVLAAGVAIIFMVTCLGIAVALNWLTR
jgi:hypothetical protein